jgi:RNA polymerase sigma-70 factor (ECF subfamily)
MPLSLVCAQSARSVRSVASWRVRRQMDDQADSTVLDAARAGDAGALEKLLERHQAQVYRFGLKMCRDPEDAEDVLQDTLLAMARSVRDFRGASSISTWLYTIARSFCIKKRRRSTFALAGAPQSLDTDAAAESRRLADPARGPDDVMLDKEIARALDDAIGALEPIYREVLILRDVEGLTAPEVAEVVGVTVDAVKSRLHRARLEVRRRVAPMLGIAASAGGTTPRTCRDMLVNYSRYLEGEISARVCAEMERHIEACGGCRGACESLKRSLALCHGTPSVQVPPDTQRSVRAALRELLFARP